MLHIYLNGIVYCGTIAHKHKTKRIKHGPSRDFVLKLAFIMVIICLLLVFSF